MSFLWPRPLRTPVHPVVPACSPQAAPRRANVSPSLLPFFPQPIDTPCSQASEDRAGPGRPAHPTPALEGCFSNRTSGLPCLSTPPPPSPCSLALPQHSARGRVGFGAVHGLVSLSPPACSCFCPHLYPEVAMAEVPDACIDATVGLLRHSSPGLPLPSPESLGPRDLLVLFPDLGLLLLLPSSARQELPGLCVRSPLFPRTHFLDSLIHTHGSIPLSSPVTPVSHVQPRLLSCAQTPMAAASGSPRSCFLGI